METNHKEIENIMESKINDTLEKFQEKILDTRSKMMTIQVENNNKVLILSINKIIIDTIKGSTTFTHHYNNSNICLIPMDQLDTILKVSIPNYLRTQSNRKVLEDIMESKLSQVQVIFYLLLVILIFIFLK